MWYAGTILILVITNTNETSTKEIQAKLSIKVRKMTFSVYFFEENKDAEAVFANLER